MASTATPECHSAAVVPPCVEVKPLDAGPAFAEPYGHQLVRWLAMVWQRETAMAE